MGASWEAYKAAWRVMRVDPELLLMPFLGLVLAALLLPLVIGAWIGGFTLIERFDLPALILFVLVLPYAWFWTTTFVLLDALVVVTAHERIHGGSPSLGRSAAKVGRRLGRLLAWSFLFAFVISILALLGRRGGAGRLAAWAGGVAVSLASMFVVPHLVLEGGTIRGAVKHSGQVVFERFGPVSSRTVKFGLYGMLITLGLVWFGPTVTGILSQMVPNAPYAFVIAMIVLPFALAFVFLCLHGVAWSIYKTAVFDSMRGKTTTWFPEEALLSPFD